MSCGFHNSSKGDKTPDPYTPEQVKALIDEFVKAEQANYRAIDPFKEKERALEVAIQALTKRKAKAESWIKICKEFQNSAILTKDTVDVLISKIVVLADRSVHVHFK